MAVMVCEASISKEQRRRGSLQPCDQPAKKLSEPFSVAATRVTSFKGLTWLSMERGNVDHRFPRNVAHAPKLAALPEKAKHCADENQMLIDRLRPEVIGQLPLEGI